MKSLFCYSLLFLSLLSCKKNAPDAIADMEVTVSGNTVTLYNNSRLCVAENYDIDWGNLEKEHTKDLKVTHNYAVLPNAKAYTIVLTVYNTDNKPAKSTWAVTIR